MPATQACLEGKWDRVPIDPGPHMFALPSELAALPPRRISEATYCDLLYSLEPPLRLHVGASHPGLHASNDRGLAASPAEAIALNLLFPRQPPAVSPQTLEGAVVVIRGGKVVS